MSQELADGVRHALAGLERREAYVLRMRYGIGTGDDHALADLARELEVSRERRSGQRRARELLAETV